MIVLAALFVAALAAAAVAASIAWTGLRVAAEIKSARASGAPAKTDRTAEVLALFAPGISEVASDPRALLVWQPMATAARKIFPAEFASLDQAFGRMFPFTLDQLQASHARWTTDWLSWERTHDSECKLKAAAIEAELGDRTATPYGRTRLEAVEFEKLDRYQRRYEEYTRVSRGLQTLIQGSAASPK